MTIFGINLNVYLVPLIVSDFRKLIDKSLIEYCLYLRKMLIDKEWCCINYVDAKDLLGPSLTIAYDGNETFQANVPEACWKQLKCIGRIH